MNPFPVWGSRLGAPETVTRLTRQGLRRPFESGMRIPLVESIRRLG